MPILVENRKLLEAYRRGDEAALTQVFDHYAADVARFLRLGFTFHAAGRAVRFGGYSEIFDLEDTMQEVFRRVFSETARMNYDGIRPFRTYLLTVARNAVINDYIAKRRDLERRGYRDTAAIPNSDDWSAADDALDEAPTVPTGNPERDVQTGQLQHLVREFKETLSGREKLVFEHRFHEGKSHRMIEEDTGLSASKIKTTEAKLRKRLFTFIKRHGYFGGVPDTRKQQGAEPVPEGNGNGGFQP